MSWQPDEATLAEIRGFALQNALEYEGKANPGSVIGRIMGARQDLRAHGSLVSPLISKAVAEANKIANQEGLDAVRAILEAEAPHLLEKREKQKKREGLPELPNAEKGNVVLRFAPNPNGPLSFGHARGLTINGEYAKLYDGKLILRFDDTDTVVKKPLIEAYQQIQDEAKWLLGFEPHKVVLASDRMDNYHSYAQKMLEDGFGYVCQCTGDEFKEFRVSKTECPHRNQTPEENLELWNKMRDGTFKPGDAVVRVKTDMSLKNPALRDWPALRIQDTQTNPHPRIEVGSTWRVWPLLDFQSAIEDYLQGVTHIIRGKDLMDSTRKQKLLYEHFGWTYPETLYWGRVKVHEWGGFSTSQMRKDIESGKYDGWDDPRLPTISALANRGITAEALRNFWIELGLTQKDISVPLATLYSHNIKVVDDDAPRISFVRNSHEIKLEGEYPNELVIPIHPNHDLGDRIFKLDDGLVCIEKEDYEKQILRLKDFADVEITSDLAKITSIEKSDSRPIVHWLSAKNANQGLLVLPNEDSIQFISGMIEDNDYPEGTFVQIERIGYGKMVDSTTILFSHK